MATKKDAMADILSGSKPTSAGPTRRVSIEPADNGFIVDTDKDSGDGPYIPSKKSVYADLDGVKGHLDKHLPAKGGKVKKVIEVGKPKTKKLKVVDLDKKK